MLKIICRHNRPGPNYHYCQTLKLLFPISPLQLNEYLLIKLIVKLLHSYRQPAAGPVTFVEFGWYVFTIFGNSYDVGHHKHLVCFLKMHS